MPSWLLAVASAYLLANELAESLVEALFPTQGKYAWQQPGTLELCCVAAGPRTPVESCQTGRSSGYPDESGDPAGSV